jgi:hypothetical protein
MPDRTTQPFGVVTMNVGTGLAGRALFASIFGVDSLRMAPASKRGELPSGSTVELPDSEINQTA